MFAQGNDFSTCLGADPQGRGGMSKSGGSFTHPGDPIEWSGGIQSWGPPDQSWIDVVGRAPGATGVEIIRTDGVVVEASIRVSAHGVLAKPFAPATLIKGIGQQPTLRRLVAREGVDHRDTGTRCQR